MLNFMGLGFSFGAKDAGLNAALGDIQSSLSSITARMEGLSSPDSGISGLADALSVDVPDAAKTGSDALSKGVGSMLGKGFALRGAFGAIGIAAGAVGGALGGIGGILGSAGSAMGDFISSFSPSAMASGLSALTGSINLTSGLEQEMAGLGASARATGANMGYTGAALNRFTSQAAGMAHGLAIGADQAAQALRGYEEASAEMGAVGIDNAQDLARFTAGFNVSADVLRDGMLQMRNEFGFTDAEIQGVIGSMTAMGQHTGDVSGALGDLPAILAQVRSHAVQMGGDLNPQQLADFARQTSALAAGMFQFDQNSERARGAALAISGALMESRTQFQALFSGTQDELPSFVTAIARSTGNVEEAFAAMEAGPSGFMTTMAQAVMAMRARGEDVGQQLLFMRDSLTETFGAEAAEQMVSFYSQADAATLETMASVQGATRDLGALGREAHSTGRTLQDSLDMALASANQQLANLSRSEAREFVRDTARDMRAMGQSIAEVGRGNGPLASFVQQMSLASRIGGLAFLPPQLRSTAMMAQQMSTHMGAMLDSFSSLGGILGMVRTGLALFATRVLTSHQATESWGETIARVGREFVGLAADGLRRAGEFIANIARQFAEFDMTTIFGGGDGDSKSMFAPLVEAFDEVPWAEIWDNLKKGFNNIPWAEMWEGISSTASSLWNDTIKPLLESIWADMQPWLLENAPEIIKWTAAAVVGAAGILIAAVLVPIGAVAAAVGVILTEWFLGFMEDVSQLGEAFEYVWDEFIVEPITDGIDSAKAHVVDRLMDVRSTFLNVFSNVRMFVSGVINGIVTTVTNAFNRMTSNVSGFASSTGGVFTSIGAAASAMWEGMVSYVSDVFTRIVAVIQGVAGSVVAAWDGIVALLRVPWDGFAAWFSGIWTTASEAVSGIIEGIGLFFVNLSTTAVVTVTNMVATLIGLFERVRLAGSGAFNGIMDVVRENHENSVNTVVGEDMMATAEVVNATTDAIATHFEEVLFGATVRALTTGFTNAFAQITEATDNFGTALIENMTRLATNIATIFVDMYTTVAVGALTAALAMEVAMGQIAQRMQQMTVAQNILADARNTAAEAARAAADPNAEVQRAAQIRNLSVEAQAIHNPQWYSGSGGYRDLFRSEMAALRAAILASVTQTNTNPEMVRALLTALQNQRPAASGGTRGGSVTTPGRGNSGNRRVTR